MDSDRNFLLGIAALQSGLINPAQLAEAATEWASDPRRPLLDVLMSKGWISGERRSTLEARAHDLERSTVKALHNGVEPPKEDGRFLGDGDHAGDDRPTRSWDSGGDRVFASDDMAEMLADGFGPRYINPVLHAAGGLGRIWRVLDTTLGREVAIKDILPQPSPSPFVTPRFLEEARISAQLEHPNIVPVHDLVEWPDQPFYTMRFLGSLTLNTAVHLHHGKVAEGETQSWTLRRLLEAFLAVCNAIAFAHSKEIIHRDIKGQNVILGEFGEVILLDWGLAKRLDSDDDPLAQPIPGAVIAPDRSMSCGTLPGQAIGTPNYMAPEQAAGLHDRIGKRTDVFGLGAMLYLILTGGPPYQGGNTSEILQQAIQATPQPPLKIQGSTPAALQAICLKAMQREPADRYASVTDLADDVRHWLDDEPVTALADTRVEKLGRWGRKNQPVVAGTVALLATAVVALALGGWLVFREKEKVEIEKANVEHEKDNVLVEQYRLKAALQIASDSVLSGARVIATTLHVIRTDLPPMNDPKTEAIRLKLAEITAKYAQGLRVRTTWEPQVRILVSDALREAAKVHQQAYEFEKAEGLFKEAIQSLKPLGPESTLEPFVLHNMAEYDIELGGVALLRDRPRDAEPAFLEALRLCRLLRKKSPSEPRYERTEARVLTSLAQVDLEMRTPKDAVERLEKGLSLLRKLADSKTPGPLDSWLVALGEISLADAMRHAGQIPEAKARLEEADRRLRGLLDKEPDNNDLRWMQSLSWIGQGQVLATRPDARDEAIRREDEAIKALTRLKAERPAVVVYGESLTLALMERGFLLAEARESAKAREDFDLAVKTADEILKKAPQATRSRGDRARALCGLAKLALTEGHPAKAKQTLDEAGKDLEAALESNPTSPTHLGTAATLAALKKQADEAR